MARRARPGRCASPMRCSAARAWLRALAWANIVLGVALGIYTGILLNTMVARPLWNSAILGPLFLFSGLSAGAAMVHLAGASLPATPRARGHDRRRNRRAVAAARAAAARAGHRDVADARRHRLPRDRAGADRAAARQPRTPRRRRTPRRPRSSSAARTRWSFWGVHRRARHRWSPSRCRRSSSATGSRTPSCRRCWCWSAASRCAGSWSTPARRARSCRGRVC